MRRVIFTSVVLATSCSVAGCDESPEVYYQTFEAVVTDGAVSRGWVPAWLPKSANEIHEKHDLDTNQSLLAFRFNASEKVEVGGDCERIDPYKPKGPPFKVSWWPSDVPASKLSTYRHSFYSCEGGKAFLALSEKQGEGFYWRP